MPAGSTAPTAGVNLRNARIALLLKASGSFLSAPNPTRNRREEEGPKHGRGSDGAGISRVVCIAMMPCPWPSANSWRPAAFRLRTHRRRAWSQGARLCVSRDGRTTQSALRTHPRRAPRYAPRPPQQRSPQVRPATQRNRCSTPCESRHQQKGSQARSTDDLLAALTLAPPSATGTTRPLRCQKRRHH